MGYLRGAVRGQYEARGWQEDADCVIGLAFGDSTGSFSVNMQHAHLVAIYAGDNRSILIEDLLYDLLPEWSIRPELVVRGKASSAYGRGTGSWGVLRKSAQYMKENDLTRPLIVAQAYHIGRVALQAKKLGLNPIIPEELPRQFDRDSTQSWTRTKAFWIPRELVGGIVLKARGQI